MPSTTTTPPWMEREEEEQVDMTLRSIGSPYDKHMPILWQEGVMLWGYDMLVLVGEDHHLWYYYYCSSPPP